MEKGRIGTSVPRLEDPRLVSGAGCFLDDVHFADCLEAVFVRSEHAHALLLDIDASSARSVPGVVAVYTHRDLGEFDRSLPLGMLGPGLHHPRVQLPLAREKVHLVGEPIALIVAVNRAVGEDAADRVEVQYDPLPPVVSIADALAAKTLVHHDVPGNVAADMLHVVGDPGSVFASAPHVVDRQLWVERSAGMPLETRGVAADFDPRRGNLTVYDSTQFPTTVRSGIAAFLGLSEHNVQVVAPDIGGGFGVKIAYWYPEELLVPLAAVRLKRPVKWVEDRQEHFVASNHERGQLHEVRIAFNDEGKILALEDNWVHDTGAYTPYGVTVPLVTSMSVPGPYRVPNYRSECRVVYTNTRPVTPYRGAGYPQACFVMERMLDAVAQYLEVGRVELRRMNLLQPADFPYSKGRENEDGSPMEYDIADPPRLLDEALKVVGIDALTRAREKATKRGLRVGFGVAPYIEMTGAQLYEGARVRVEPSGRVVVATGVSCQGQGHETVLAQITADRLEIPIEQVSVVLGDTGEFGWGTGTYASRVAVIAGNAVDGAVSIVRDKALRLAADMLEASIDDLTWQNGRVVVRGDEGDGIALHELARQANPVRVAYDEGALAASQFADPRTPVFIDFSEPGLEGTYYYHGARASSASGCHAALIQIDPATFELAILRYVVIHDSGVLINPAIVEGQILGGVAQGIGAAYYEKIHYDENGQLINANFMDFLIPYSTEVPDIVVHHVGAPSPTNPLGVKGCGEAGIIPVAAVLVSAIEDALGVAISQTPLSPTVLFDITSAS